MVLLNLRKETKRKRSTKVHSSFFVNKSKPSTGSIGFVSFDALFCIFSFPLQVSSCVTSSSLDSFCLLVLLAFFLCLQLPSPFQFVLPLFILVPYLCFLLDFSFVQSQTGQNYLRAWNYCMISKTMQGYVGIIGNGLWNISSVSIWLCFANVRIWDLNH